MSSIASKGVQIATEEEAAVRCGRFRGALDSIAEQEVQQFVLWVPVAFGLGIAAWFVLPDRAAWLGASCLFGAIGAAGFAIGERLGRACFWLGLLALLGVAVVWSRAELVRAPRLDRPITTELAGRVDRVERLGGRDQTRITMVDERSLPGLRIRLSFKGDVASQIRSGVRISVHARLMPPAPPAIPGAYDFARAAWFKGIGASGRALGEARLLEDVPDVGFWAWLDRLRGRLTRHIQDRVGGVEGGIAASLATGDQGGVGEDAAQALRDSGLTHLLSISGLHVAAAVGFAMLATRRLLALSVHAATHWPLTLIGAAAGAVTGICYSFLAGGEVPTVRSCIAALLVLLGLALGREAITLRTVAAGAFVILLFRPESLIGASFQLSFAAVVSIVALNEWPWLRARLTRREEPLWAAGARMTFALLLTGLAVEAALSPIALYHFNRMGVYGAFANIIAIPLTTFVIMPLEVIALILDPLGLGGPFYALLRWALSALIGLATMVAGWPGGVALAPSMPAMAFGLMILGSLWLCLWRTRLRLAGIPLIAAGAIWAAVTPAADVYVTGDGRHLGMRDQNGQVWILRPQAGDYVKEVIGASAAAALPTQPMDASDAARCTRDACMVRLWRDQRPVQLLATRSKDFIDRPHFQPACGRADILVSDRRLPNWCQPRWLKADRSLLEQTGGITIYLSSGTVRTVAAQAAGHPWAAFKPSFAGTSPLAQ